MQRYRLHGTALYGFGSVRVAKPKNIYVRVAKPKNYLRSDSKFWISIRFNVPVNYVQVKNKLIHRSFTILVCVQTENSRSQHAACSLRVRHVVVLCHKGIAFYITGIIIA
jgi:hypothetical protein